MLFFYAVSFLFFASIDASELMLSEPPSIYTSLQKSTIPQSSQVFFEEKLCSPIQDFSHFRICVEDQLEALKALHFDLEQSPFQGLSLTFPDFLQRVREDSESLKENHELNLEFRKSLMTLLYALELNFKQIYDETSFPILNKAMDTFLSRSVPKVNVGQESFLNTYQSYEDLRSAIAESQL